MFSGIFTGSGQTKPGAQGKKMASKAKGKCSGKSDWLMAGSVQWLNGLLALHRLSGRSPSPKAGTGIG